MAGTTHLSHSPEAISASLEPHKALPSFVPEKAHPLSENSPLSHEVSRQINPFHGVDFRPGVSASRHTQDNEGSSIFAEGIIAHTERLNTRPGIDHNAEMNGRKHELSSRNQDYQQYLSLLEEVKHLARQTSTEGTQVARIAVATEPSFESVGTYDISHAQEVSDRLRSDVEDSAQWFAMQNGKHGNGAFMDAHTSGNTAVTQSGEQSNYGNRQG